MASTKYPNLAAEISRNQIEIGSLYDEVGERVGKSRDTVFNWLSTQRKGELPTYAAFAIRDMYFPGMSVDYLFSTEAITPEEAVAR